MIYSITLDNSRHLETNTRITLSQILKSHSTYSNLQKDQRGISLRDDYANNFFKMWDLKQMNNFEGHITCLIICGQIASRAWRTIYSSFKIITIAPLLFSPALQYIYLVLGWHLI